MRDNFEKESKRSREELNKQMERLRSNMSSMLQQGDQESKVLELQNSLLFNDLKAAQTEYEALKFTQLQTEEHLSHLRKELETTQSDTKVALLESKELRQHVTKSQQVIQGLQLELTRLKAQGSVSEIENERLKSNSTEEIRSLQTEIDKVPYPYPLTHTFSFFLFPLIPPSLSLLLSSVSCLPFPSPSDLCPLCPLPPLLSCQLNETMRADTMKYKATITELNHELSLAKSSVAHYQSLAEAKESALVKIEQNGHFEALKLEKKLSEQVCLLFLSSLSLTL
jgi:hypothetical protein